MFREICAHIAKAALVVSFMQPLVSEIFALGMADGPSQSLQLSVLSFS
jgi:hypothetical protein